MSFGRFPMGGSSFDGGGGDSPPMSGGSQQHNSTIVELQAQVESLSLQVQTLSRLLVEKGLVTEKELNEWLRYIDGLDGRVDGKLREKKTPKSCHQCQRINPSKAVKCQYCGAELANEFLVKEE